MTPRKFVPGSRQVSARDLNALRDASRALASLSVRGGSLEWGRTLSVYLQRHKDGLWARIDGEADAETPALAKYGWVEQEDVGGSFQDLEGGRSGTVGTSEENPAREVNDTQGIPDGTIVWLVPGVSTVNPDDDSKVDDNYLFVNPLTVIPVDNCGRNLADLNDVEQMDGFPGYTAGGEVVPVMDLSTGCWRLYEVGTCP